MRDTLLLALVGVCIGLLAALFSMRLIKHLLFELAPNDPFIITMASLEMISIAILAGYLPGAARHGSIRWWRSGVNRALP